MYCPSPSTLVVSMLQYLRSTHPSLELVFVFGMLPHDVASAVAEFTAPARAIRRGLSTDSASSDGSASVQTAPRPLVHGGRGSVVAGLGGPPDEQQQHSRLLPGPSMGNLMPSANNASSVQRQRVKGTILATYIQQLGLLFGNLQKARPETVRCPHRCVSTRALWHCILLVLLCAYARACRTL